MSQGIEARVTIGEYDETGCWHPRWLDEHGEEAPSRYELQQLRTMHEDALRLGDLVS